MSYTQHPSTSAGDMEEGVWEIQTPAVLNGKGNEITPAVWGFTVTTRTLTAEEASTFDEIDAEHADWSDRTTRKDRIATAVAWLDGRAAFYAAQPDASTNGEALVYVNTMKDDMEKIMEGLGDLILGLRVDD